MTAHQTHFPTAPSDLQVRSAWQIRRDLERAASAHGENRGRPVLHQVDEHRADQSRSCDYVCAHRLPTRRTSESGFVGRLWPGQREQGFTRLRCDDFTRPSSDQPLYDRLWGSGFLSSRYQGVKFNNGRDPVLYLSNPAGNTTGSPPPVSGRSLKAQSEERRDIRRSRDSQPRRAVRAGVSHADRRCRS